MTHGNPGRTICYGGHRAQKIIFVASFVDSGGFCSTKLATKIGLRAKSALGRLTEIEWEGDRQYWRTAEP